jgi:hypothetical protein
VDVICAYFTPKNLNFFDKFLIYFIKKISLVQSIIGATLMRGSFVLSMVLLIFILKNIPLQCCLFWTISIFYASFRTIIFEIYAKLRHYGLNNELGRKSWGQFHNANWRMEQYAFVLKLE